jgi:hypothetical protein
VLTECSHANNEALYLDVLRSSGRDLPNEPMAISGMGLGIAIIRPDLASEATAAARRSVQLARTQDRMVRHCATNLVRVAILIDDYSLLEEGLDTLVKDATNRRLEDVSLQFDFLANIDAKRLDTDLLNAYRSLA